MKPLSFTYPLVLLALLLAPLTWAQTMVAPPQDDKASLYYEPEHFVRAYVENNRVQRQDLRRLLSRQHVVIVLAQPDDYHIERMRDFLQAPPAELPAIATFELLSPAPTDAVYAVGYLQDDARQRRVPTTRAFAAYFVTFETPLRRATLLRVLHDLAHTSGVDFAMPVFAFPDKMAAPFFQFEVEFLAPELIPGGIKQIQEINRANAVTDTQKTSDFTKPVVLQLEKDAPTNILATVRRYQNMPGIVKRAQLRWLRVRRPVEVQARWAQPAGVNSFSLWEPIRYIVSIERDQDVEILPQALTERAARTWIAENTHLPDALIQVDRIDKHTQDLDNGRVSEEISVIFRLSKTGTYIFAPYPIQAAYQALDDQRRLEIFRGDKPTFLTIPGHLPGQLRQMPGQLMTMAALPAPAWMASASMIFGAGLMVVGLGWALRRSARSWVRTPTDRQSGEEELAARPLEALRAQYRERLEAARQRLEALTFQEPMETEREWLRSLSVTVKRLLGQQCYQDETHFLGGLGTSSQAIRRYMVATSRHPEQAPIAEALDLLQAVERQAPKRILSLAEDEAQDFLSQAETLTEKML